MKKNILVLLVTMLATVVMTACSNTDTWKYYDQYAKYNEQAKQVLELSMSIYENKAVNPSLADPSSEISLLYEGVKERLRQELSGYDGLDWDRFEKADLILCDGFKNANGPADACFDCVDGNVYMPKLLISRDALMNQEVLCHELFHALTAKPGKVTTLLYEGFTEWYAQSLYFLEDLDAYYFAQQFAAIYVEANGMQKAIDTLCTDDGADEIGKAIGRPNTLYTIESLLESTSMGNFALADVTIIMDVLAHYSVAASAGFELVRDINELSYYVYGNTAFHDYIDSVLEGGDFHG